MTSVVESHPAPTHLSVDHTDQAFHVVSRGMDGHGVCQPMETWVMLASFFFFSSMLVEGISVHIPGGWHEGRAEAGPLTWLG